MLPVEIYTTPSCGFCHAAKRLLTQKGIGFSEIDVAREPQLRQQMMDRANGGYTVPQIFINEMHIGGYTDMALLDHNDTLDSLLEN